eukprot:GHUV01055716.1.p1 GENE.GHUV01055716.1~~GHUV01055716.1.p1  ORF type:complete len:115 (-),score=31.78 GHUV01055716.1:271-615(-)
MMAAASVHCTCPMFLQLLQVSPTSIRGTLGSLNQLMICVGILAALLVNVAVPAADWRTMFNLAVIPAGALLLGKDRQRSIWQYWLCVVMVFVVLLVCVCWYPCCTDGERGCPRG